MCHQCTLLQCYVIANRNAPFLLGLAKAALSHPGPEWSGYFSIAISATRQLAITWAGSA